MRCQILSIALLGAVVAPADAQYEERAPLRVITTIGVLADLAEEVGGARVDVESLTDGRVDAHYVQPRPTLMRKVRDADVFVEVGLAYELWADRVVDGAGNPRLALGQPGRVLASAGISTIEVPAQLSRELGDVHPDGNPHLWLDPLRLREMAETVAEGLTRADPAGAEHYASRLADYQRRLDVALFGAALVDDVGAAKLARLEERGRLDAFLEARGLEDVLGGWMARARALEGREVVSYHKTYGYLAQRFDFAVAIEIEEHAGIQPSARHRDRVLERMRSSAIGTILQASFYDTQAAEWLAERTGAELVRLPLDCGGRTGVQGSLGLIEAYLDALLASS